MARVMKITAAVSVVLTLLLALLHIHQGSALSLSLAITFCTVAYHFSMRLLVGKVFDMIFHNDIDYRLGWFAVGERETRLYQKLNVRKWSKRMPTYDKSAFDLESHTLGEIAGAMCQAELVHELIAILSLLPIVASIWLGETWVFVCTSLLAALFDLSFVIMQRYNRPRVVRLIERVEKRGRE